MNAPPDRRFLFGLVLAMFASGCGQGRTIATSFVQPELGDPCAHPMCGAHGTCTVSKAGDPLCICTAGFTGDKCQSCAPSFHRDANGHCAPDRSCADQPEDPCGSHGKCNDAEGVIACDCDVGYEGPRCELCANSYGRDRHDDCLLLTLGTGNAGSPGIGRPLDAGEPGSDSVASTVDSGTSSTHPTPGGACVPGTLTFDSSTGFPTASNTCVSSPGTMALPEMSLTSTGGTGTVWKCAANTFYHFNSNHVALELHAGASAGLTFDSAITALGFDLAARLGAVSVSVLADGKEVTSLAQAENGKTTVAFAFAAPVTMIEFRSTTPDSSQIALDNISYEAAECSK